MMECIRERRLHAWIVGISVKMVNRTPGKFVICDMSFVWERVKKKKRLLRACPPPPLSVKRSRIPRVPSKDTTIRARGEVISAEKEHTSGNVPLKKAKDESSSILSLYGLYSQAMACKAPLFEYYVVQPALALKHGVDRTGRPCFFIRNQCFPRLSRHQQNTRRLDSYAASLHPAKLFSCSWIPAIRMRGKVGNPTRGGHG